MIWAATVCIMLGFSCLAIAWLVADSESGDIMSGAIIGGAGSAFLLCATILLAAVVLQQWG